MYEWMDGWMDRFIHIIYVCFVELLNDILMEFENTVDLKPIVEKLQSTIDSLVIKVENMLKAKMS